jgi:hypothetical protein
MWPITRLGAVQKPDAVTVCIKGEGFETLRKAVPQTSLFLSYMELLFPVSRGKTRKTDTGKRDYRHRSLAAVLAGGKRG